ncbi:MAG: NAD(P)-dependent oxidoreductase [Terracidiphilus sp.]|nr:NAD(P)-dependent oxidoreductase [Terracidiphilus sp.]
MLRVGYPATISAEFLKCFPDDVELVALPDGLEQETAIDVWIPDPYTPKALKVWPHLRGVKLVLSLMAGTEWIRPTVSPDVQICSGRGAHSPSTAEWALTAILTMLRHVPFYVSVQQSEVWKRRFEMPTLYAEITGDHRRLYPPVLQEELTGKRVLLVGHGSIGQQIERLLGPFDVELTRVARTARENPRVHAVGELDALLPEVEIVILILPLTPESKHLIGKRQFELMRQGTLVVNAARGAVVDTDALVEALQSGKIRAAVDVTDPEPLPLGHALWSCPNVFITPHVAGSTPEFARRSMQVAADELRRYMKGEPLANRA